MILMADILATLLIIVGIIFIILAVNEREYLQFKIFLIAIVTIWICFIVNPEIPPIQCNIDKQALQGFDATTSIMFIIFSIVCIIPLGLGILGLIENYKHRYKEKEIIFLSITIILAIIGTTFSLVYFVFRKCY